MPKEIVVERVRASFLGLCVCLPAAAQSPLTTVFAGGNQGNIGGAVYFDLVVSSSLSITGLEVNTSDAAGTLVVRITPGTHMGSELIPSAWREVGTGALTSAAGAGAPSTVTLNAPIRLEQGTYGVQLDADGFRHVYTNGTGTSTYQTRELRLLAGAAVNDPTNPGGPVFKPRIWNGSIHYEAWHIDAGPFLGAGMTYTVRLNTFDPGGTMIPASALHTKKPGFAPGAETSVPGRPVFTFDAMFGPTVAPNIRVDAFSIGQDYLWVDPCRNDGIMGYPDGEWLAVSLSARRPTSGVAPPSFGPLAVEDSDDDGFAGDVWTYIGLASSIPGHAGKMYRAIDAEELGMARSSAGAQPDITGLDAHIEAYLLDDEFSNALPPPVVFFSVTDNTTSSVPTPWWNGETPSGALVFFTRWDPAMSRWSPPRPWIAPADLGLADTDDIDALAIDMRHEISHNVIHVVFSTTQGHAQPWGELAFVPVFLGPTDGPPTPVPFKDTDDTEVAEKPGTGARIDAVCGSDPGPFQDRSRRFLWGTPDEPGATSGSPAFVVRTADASISTMRSCWGPSGGGRAGRIVSHLSGWPDGFPTTDFVVLTVSFQDPETWTGLPAFFVGSALRLPVLPGAPGEPNRDGLATGQLNYPPVPVILDLDCWFSWVILGPEIVRTQFSHIRM